MTTIGVVGLGLIGGSFALAARRAGHVVVAWDGDPATREAAAGQELNVSADLSVAELVVLAVPMPALTDGLPALLGSVHLADSATITDVGSLKQPVATAMHAAGLAQRYVGGHPMAGTQRFGFAAATADLFRAARWALCLDGDDGDGRVSRWLSVAALLTDLGSGVVAVTPAEHDQAMATVSGVPHLLALALSTVAAEAGPLLTTLAAGSFGDLTRVAASDPALLRAIIGDNETALRFAVRRLLDQLDRPWPDLIESGHAARQALIGRAVPDRSADVNLLTVSDAGSLLELGRVGAVVETVDAATGVVGYREPTRS